MSDLVQWKQRVDGVHYLGERNLYVTHEEYGELRTSWEDVDPAETDDQRRARELRESIARMNGALDYFLATPVVVDDDEAAAQQARLAAALKEDQP